MKRKLTIAVDAEIVPLAKRYARSCGVSLSSLVEQSLRALTKDAEPSFVEQWAGKFEPADRHGDPRYEHLARKYGL